MSRAPTQAFRAWTDRARMVPILDFADRRQLKLRGGVEKSGPCPRPGCGGRDRFSLNTVKGLFSCRQCGGKGDVIDLARMVDGCDFLTACQTLTGEAPPNGDSHELDPATLAEAEELRRANAEEQARASDVYRQRERKVARAIWERRANRPARGSMVEDYLRLRRLALPPRHSLRFAPDARYYETGAKGPPLHVGPAMLAGIIGPEGRFHGVHQTFLDLSKPSGKAELFSKATGEQLPAKKVRGSQSAGRIELSRVDEPTGLVIGEGIETVLSAREALLAAGEDVSRVAFWSSVCLGNLGGPALAPVKHPTDKHRNGHFKTLPGPLPAPIGGIPIPDSVVDVVLLGDADSDPFLVRMTLERASRRWARSGRVIRGAYAPAGLDFNDYWRQP